MSSYERNIRHSDAYGRQRHYDDSRDGWNSREDEQDEKKNERWRKMTKMSANYARSARYKVFQLAAVTKLSNNQQSKVDI